MKASFLILNHVFINFTRACLSRRISGSESLSAATIIFTLKRIENNDGRAVTKTVVNRISAGFNTRADERGVYLFRLNLEIIIIQASVGASTWLAHLIISGGRFTESPLQFSLKDDVDAERILRLT